MLDTCKTDVRVGLFQANFKNRFVSGHDFSRAVKAQQKSGPLGPELLFPGSVRALRGRTEPQVTQRNQSRRDGTICSPARECRVG